MDVFPFSSPDRSYTEWQTRASSVTVVTGSSRQVVGPDAKRVFLCFGTLTANVFLAPDVAAAVNSGLNISTSVPTILDWPEHGGMTQRQWNGTTSAASAVIFVIEGFWSPAGLAGDQNAGLANEGDLNEDRAPAAYDYGRDHSDAAARSEPAPSSGGDLAAAGWQALLGLRSRRSPGQWPDDSGGDEAADLES